MQNIRKAVFPVAGLGTRFLPATKANPKEMLPIVDKPLIQFAVEEAIQSGITDLVFVTGRSKRAIEDHFDTSFELEAELTTRNDEKLLALVRDILPANVRCAYIRQSRALGLGHAVLCAQHVVGDEPFAVVLADDLIDSDTPVLKQLMEVSAAQNASVLGVQDVPRADTGSYGIVSGSPISKSIERVSHIVEKPQPDVAPSTLAVVGRYILSPRIFHHLGRIERGSGGEIQLTDGIASLIAEEPVVACRYEGRRYDCGSKLGYLQATVALGRKHAEVGDDFSRWLAEQ
ncbi:UTP--glucose-1-phosphate uridylyltransferase GalU [Noviherbaspirillum saxi]|uniref:UTP--glucose-1-phosphate uridylyltransferase n=1 Tax=Noviherbaspirillum saxi TaxID=2320863 RepID=A0A3A3FSL4_9BURK|nr:UTP--glucose-1-phosphate uridylyltransferase GalU [Noviherbaspirillum saxi]RJF98520.1 UTP--glucose-1-phosphate uridylyltransferase [Noviherbaspirillum saxi]